MRLLAGVGGWYKARMVEFGKKIQQHSTWHSQLMYHRFAGL
jgi:hypothetical protein